MLGDETLRVYQPSDPTPATVYTCGEIVEAGPSFPEETMPVDEVFA